MMPLGEKKHESMREVLRRFDRHLFATTLSKAPELKRGLASGGRGARAPKCFATPVEFPPADVAPFRIGNPLPNRFVHVLDEMTVDTVLRELDTVPDLVAYLAPVSLGLS
jgi:hypothetical protein